MSNVSSSASTRSHELRSREWLIPAAFTVASLVLGLISLGSRSFWVDESVSISFAQKPWATFWHIVIHREPNMVLYHALLKPWASVADTEGSIRFLSVLFAAATVPVLYLLARRLFDSRIAVLATALLVLNATFVRYAQEARGYSLLVFMATLSTLLFVRATERPSYTQWLVLGVTLGLTVYAHVFGMLLLPVYLLALARDLRAIWRPVLAGTIAACALAVPIGLAFILLPAKSHIDWAVEPGLAELWALAVFFAGGSLLLLAIYAIPCLLAAVQGIRAWRPLLLLITWLLVPAALAFVLSQVKPVFVPRYFLISMPVLPILAAAGLGRIKRRTLFSLAVVVALAGSVHALLDFYRAPETQDWNGVVEHVLSNAAPDDAIIIHADVVAPAFLYYAERMHRPVSSLNLVYPRLDERIGLPPLPTRGDEILASADRLARPLARASAERDRIWLVLSHHRLARLGRDKITAEIERVLAASHPNRTEQQFSGVYVRLYERPR